MGKERRRSDKVEASYSYVEIAKQLNITDTALIRILVERANEALPKIGAGWDGATSLEQFDKAVARSRAILEQIIAAHEEQAKEQRRIWDENARERLSYSDSTGNA